MARKSKADPEVVEQLTHSTGFEPDVVEALATHGSAVNIPEGWSIIMETTPADSAYILLQGEVEIRKNKETLATLGAGSVFGEIALVNHRLRNASVVSVSPVRALRLSDEALKAILDTKPDFADTLREMASARVDDK